LLKFADFVDAPSASTCDSSLGAGHLWDLRGDAAMGDLEFKRELSPEQMREALSLLENVARAQNQNLWIGDLNRVEEVDPKPYQAGTTPAMQDRFSAAEGLQQCKKHLSLGKKHLNSAVALVGIGIAAAGALTVWAWSGGVRQLPTHVVTDEQPPNQPAALPAIGASAALPVAKSPPDQSPVGSAGKQASAPELAGLNPMRYANRGDDRTAVGNASDRGNAIAPVAGSVTDQAIGTSQARSGERVNQKPEHNWKRARAVRVAAAKRRYWRRYSQTRAEIYGGAWCFFGCRAWGTQRGFYESSRVGGE
jgi:hypothetical protein